MLKPTIQFLVVRESGTERGCVWDDGVVTMHLETCGYVQKEMSEG